MFREKGWRFVPIGFCADVMSRRSLVQAGERTCYARRMNVALRIPRMTRDQFFAWAEAQDARYEFDGCQPVAMTGGSFRHSLICHNLWAALRAGLRDGPCRVAGPDAGVATLGDAVRYPDALVTCAPPAGEAVLVPGVIAIFEVLSPSSHQNDRIIKVREYAVVGSIRRYVIVEHRSAGLTSFVRADAAAPWTATTLMAGDVLDMAEIGLSVPVAALYEGVSLPADPEGD